MTTAPLADLVFVPEDFSSRPLLASLEALKGLRVAIVHDWLTAYAGSEKVVEQILAMFPEADLFTLVDHLPEAERGFLGGRPVYTSFMQNIPASRKMFRKLLWLLPIAAESFDLSAYDIVISSSHAVAKGVLTGPDQVHICYCHSPIRYAWDLQHQYLQQAGLDRGITSLYARLVLHYLRLWDTRTSNGVNHFVANSEFVSRRINKAYGRSSSVVHPPVDVESFALCESKDDYFLIVSRLVPYKRVHLVVSAFARMPDRRLIVVGEGQDLNRCKAISTPNIQILPQQPPHKLQGLMRAAKAFVFAAEEDFGITMVEAQACGTPVIAYGRGGALDSVISEKTGLFFASQTEDSIVDCVQRFESGEITLAPAAELRAHSLKFSAAEFQRRFAAVISQCWLDFHSPGPKPPVAFSAVN